MAKPTRTSGRKLFPSLSHPGDQKVTFVELFFDLVFVFAITQVTKYVVSDLTIGGAAEALLLFWMIWWGWTQFTWALNPADTTHVVVRLTVLVATGFGFLMAVNVPDAYGPTGLWFAVPYVIVRLMGMSIYAAAAGVRQRPAVLLFAAWSFPAMVLVLIGAAMDSPTRAWFWLAAVVVDLIAAGVAGSHSGWDVQPSHFAERHSLIVIIALGESLIVAGQSVLATESSLLLISVALGAVAISCLLWWLYFGWWQEAIEHRAIELTGPVRTVFVRDVYSMGHFPLMAGIIAMAVAIEEMVLHPEEPLSAVVRVTLLAGVLLFLSATDFGWWRARRKLLLLRTAVGLILAALVLAFELPALPEVGMVATGFLLIAILEGVWRPDRELPDPVSEPASKPLPE